MENLKIYDMLKEVPKEAQKKITGGRLVGMTDIKPMWRIQKLTETFGPVGLGWYTETTKKEIIDGANGEKIATVDILLYVNYKAPYELDEDLWSKPIEGSGGSSFIAKEQKGLYTSDECFKMAYTDALSVACKGLGMGADVYWGDSKYDTSKKINTEEEAKNYKLTFGKFNGKTLQEVAEENEWYITSYLLANGDETILTALKLMGYEVLSEEEAQERMMLLQELSGIMNEKGIDREKLYKHYKVNSNAELTSEQLRDAIERLNK